MSLSRRLAAAAALSIAAARAGAQEALPDRFVCRGNEPFWSLRVDGAQASYATPEDTAGRALRGQLTRAESAAPSFMVWRGSAAGEATLAAFVSREACADSMSDERFEYRVRLSMPDATLRVGCCSTLAALSPQPAAAAPAPLPARAPVPEPAPAPAPPPARPPAVTPLPSPVAGRVVGLALDDGTICRSSGRGGTLAFEGRRVNFTCPSTPDGRRPVLLGPLEPAGPGAFRVTRGALGHEGDRFVLRDEQQVAARVAEIEILGQRLCVSPPQGPTLDLGGDRLTYSCGSDSVDQVALLGELEPVAGGLAITRAVVAQEERAFVVRSRERIVVAAP